MIMIRPAKVIELGLRNASRHDCAGALLIFFFLWGGIKQTVEGRGNNGDTGVWILRTSFTQVL